MIKKQILKLSMSGIAIAPIATMLACSEDEVKELTEQKVTLVLGGGSIDDKSFNEQAFEALTDIYKILYDKKPSKTADVLVPSEGSAKNISEKYVAALDAKTTIVLAPGFKHQAAIELFNKEFGEDKLKFIVADAKSFAKNVIGIQYDTKSSSFLAGVLAGLYLKSKGDSDPKVGTFGGGNFAGVTDFMVGFVKGIEYYNKSVKQQADPAIIFYQFGTNDAWTDSGFNSGGGTTKAASMVADEVDIILPVAGPQTADAIIAAKARTGGKETMVIGVDTNQKLLYPKGRDKILTSILKNLRLSLKEVWYQQTLKQAYPKSQFKKFGETYQGTLKNKWTGLEMTSTDATLTSIYTEIKKLDIQKAAQTKEVKDTTWAEALVIAKSLN